MTLDGASIVGRGSLERLVKSVHCQPCVNRAAEKTFEIARRQRVEGAR
jgi:hypothetical protein